MVSRSADAGEKELDRFIERQSKGGQAAQERARLWQESAERNRQHELNRNRWAWARHFRRMASNHQELAESYRQRAEQLEGA